MADYLNPQDLANAKVDAKTLGEAVNDKKVVKPRYGDSYKSIPLLSADGEIAISELKEAIDIAAEAGAGENGWTDKLVLTWSGQTQESKNKESITPIDYKAKGDGVTNDTQAFVDLELSNNGQTVDLLGKTYKVDRDFTKNHYTNGSLRIINSNRGKGRFPASPLSYKLSNGNGQRVGELVVPLYDDVVATASTIIQSVCYSPSANALYAQRVLRGKGEEEECVIDSFTYSDIGVVGMLPTFTSKPLNFVGHQSLAVTSIVVGGVRSRRFWATAGGTKGAERSRYVVSFLLDSATGEASDVRYHKVFSDDWLGATVPVMSVSPNNEFLVVTCTHPQRGRYVRVFKVSEIMDDGDYSSNSIYEFGFGLYAGRDPQCICTDGQYIYILHGGASGVIPKVEIFTLDGSFVGLDDNFTVGTFDASQLPYYYYEPESLFVGEGGRLMCSIAAGKRDGSQARGSYTNIISVVDFYETKNLTTDGNRPLVVMRANKCIAHIDKPITISHLTADGYADYFTMSQAAIRINRPTSGNYAFQITSKSQTQFRATNSLNDIALQVSVSGVGGIFSAQRSKYMIGLPQNSNEANVQFDMRVDGYLDFRPPRSIEPQTNGYLSIEATSNTELKLKYKGTDGVVRSASLPLT